MLVYEHKPCFLPEVEQDEESGNLRIVEPLEKAQINFFEPKQIKDFDFFLSKACEICILDDLDNEQRTKGWFKILSFLTQFKSEAMKKAAEAIRQSEISVGGNSNFSNLHESRKAEYIKKIQDFLIDRIDYILRFPRLDIPLKNIMEQLSLTFSQIQELCSQKLKHNLTTINIENTQQKIITN